MFFFAGGGRNGCPTRPPIWWYGAAAGIALATGLRRLLDPVLGDRFTFATLFLAVLLTARYGGFGPTVAAIMRVPLAARGRGLGVISFIAGESRRRYDANDLAVAEDLARRAAVAIENARLWPGCARRCGRRTERRPGARPSSATNVATPWPRPAAPCTS